MGTFFNTTYIGVCSDGCCPNSARKFHFLFLGLVRFPPKSSKLDRFEQLGVYATASLVSPLPIAIILHQHWNYLPND
jgi:hypothetical protein